jgi:hypothetical protein
MHEHGCEERREVTDGVGKEAAGNKSPLHNESVTAIQFYEEKQNVQDDQSVGNQWNCSTRAIIITDW